MLLAEEVLLVMESFYPEQHSEYRRLVEGDTPQKPTHTPAQHVSIPLLHAHTKYGCVCGFSPLHLPSLTHTHTHTHTHRPVAALTVNYNKALAYERREERRSHYDVHTQVTHYPLVKIQRVERPRFPHGTDAADAQRSILYPIALMPGQYQHPYRM